MDYVKMVNIKIIKFQGDLAALEISFRTLVFFFQSSTSIFVTPPISRENSSAVNNDRNARGITQKQSIEHLKNKRRTVNIETKKTTTALTLLRACLHGGGTPVQWGWFLLFSRSEGLKTKENYPTRPGSPTPCIQGLSPRMLNFNFFLTRPINYHKKRF